MAVVVLTVKASEESTYIVSGTFTDEDDSELIPSTLTWSLSTLDGTIINSRDDEVVSSPASVTYVVLSGDDLVLLTGEAGTVYRRFTFKGTYTSSYGSGLPITGECKFPLQGFKNVP